jgi:muramoyltetrapeptide carboxypeptidase
MSAARLQALPLRRLAPGARVRVIAPSSPFPRADFERGLERLRARYDVHVDAGIFERHGYLAGDDARRARELRAAIADDTADAIFAARGGYGATRVLEHVDVAALARRPKLLAGFSDISALHASWARAGLGSLHAPMIAVLGRSGDALAARFIAAVEGATPQQLDGLQTITPGRARGVLFGGNLAVLTALIGTPYLPPLDGCVLFLEDVGERPYRVDRMLTQWLHAGLLHKPCAIVLGAFSDCNANPDGVQVEHVLQERLGTLGIPVLAGVPAGHVDDNLELPLGALCEVDAARGSIALETRWI